MILLFEYSEVMFLSVTKVLEYRSQHFVLCLLGSHPVEVVHVDFELDGLPRNCNQIAADTGISLNQLVLSAAKKTPSPREDETGRDFAAGVAFPGEIDIRTANAVIFDRLMAFGTH
jgi:hypothetical protein